MEMKILEELKAAQQTISCFDRDYWSEFFSYDLLTVKEVTQLEAVLRRIPQLIEVVEWIESVSNRTDGEFGASQTLNAYQFAKEIRRLLSKAPSEEATKMTTEQQSVLEKLKRIAEAKRVWECAAIEDLAHKESFYGGILRMFAHEDLPRLIAALELVEVRSKDSTLEVQSISHQQRRQHQRDFARELLAILNNETKGE